MAKKKTVKKKATKKAAPKKKTTKKAKPKDDGTVDELIVVVRQVAILEHRVHVRTPGNLTPTELMRVCRGVASQVDPEDATILELVAPGSEDFTFTNPMVKELQLETDWDVTRKDDGGLQMLPNPEAGKLNGWKPGPDKQPEDIVYPDGIDAPQPPEPEEPEEEDYGEAEVEVEVAEGDDDYDNPEEEEPESGPAEEEPEPETEPEEQEFADAVDAAIETNAATADYERITETKTLEGSEWDRLHGLLELTEASGDYGETDVIQDFAHAVAGIGIAVVTVDNGTEGPFVDAYLTDETGDNIILELNPPRNTLEEPFEFVLDDHKKVICMNFKRKLTRRGSKKKS
jgi:hypothetical protein